MRLRFAGVVAAGALVTSGFGATLALSKAEDVGMSSERLKRIRPMIQSHVDGKDFSGAVTLVARKGKVVHFEAHGLADVEGPLDLHLDDVAGEVVLREARTHAVGGHGNGL